VLGEGVGREARIAVLLGTGRNLRPVQDLDFGSREPKEEILGEEIKIRCRTLTYDLRTAPRRRRVTGKKPCQGT
jgi:hypothetical protein